MAGLNPGHAGRVRGLFPIPAERPLYFRAFLARVDALLQRRGLTSPLMLRPILSQSYGKDGYDCVARDGAHSFCIFAGLDAGTGFSPDASSAPARRNSFDPPFLSRPMSASLQAMVRRLQQLHVRARRPFQHLHRISLHLAQAAALHHLGILRHFKTRI